MLGECRVLEVGNRLGWLAGRLLADLGAAVVRVEAPGAKIDGADWQAYNVNKRLLRLDLEAAAGQSAFDALIAGIDILIESAQPSDPLARLLAHSRLRQINPRLVHVSVTPFGGSGPRADWLASDIELMAAGGAMSLAGEADGTPTRITVPQSYCWAGAQAAVGALTALVNRTLTGCGQHVDVSAQAAVMLATFHAPSYWDVLGICPTRAGAYITGRSVKGTRYRAFWPCADGYINFALYGGASGRRSNAQLVEWMRERNAELGVLGQMDWKRFVTTLATQEEVEAMEHPIARFFLGIRKREFLQEATRREMMGYPVSTTQDIAGDPQLSARNFWQDVPAPDGSTRRHCGSFAVVNRERAPIRHAPGEEIDLRRLLAESGGAERRPDEARAAGRKGNPQALAGVKVVEFAAYAAGPHIGKMLATFGATVVHVESHQRPDGFRTEYPPFKDGKPGLDRSGCFAFFNDSKYGVTLDLKKDEGVALARRLLAWADVVVENMRPGVMERLGLGYEAACAENPGIVMISSCNMGQTGPRAHTPGFGSQLSAFAGFCGLTGSPDASPMLLYGPYIDFIAASLGTAAVLAAVDRQRRTGQGACIDLAQYESGLHFLAGALLDYHTTGAVAERSKNRDPDAAPHDAYRCADGRWLAISCWSDQEFGRLAAVLQRSDLPADPRLATLESRQDNAGELDAILRRWCLLRDAEAAATALQAAKVHAYPVNTIADLFVDPQLKPRGLWRHRRHGAMGEVVSYYSAYELSETPGEVTGAAPLLGADNELVFQEFIGLSTKEYDEYLALGAFD